MKNWTIKIFVKNEHQIFFKRNDSLIRDDEMISQITMKSKSKFPVKKLARAIINRIPFAESYSIKYEGDIED